MQGIAGWSDVKAKIQRNDGRPLAGGPCRTPGREKILKTSLLTFEDYAKFRESICLQSNVVYKVEMEFPKAVIPGESVLVDSVSFAFVIIHPHFIRIDKENDASFRTESIMFISRQLCTDTILLSQF